VPRVGDLANELRCTANEMQRAARILGVALPATSPTPLNISTLAPRNHAVQAICHEQLGNFARAALPSTPFSRRKPSRLLKNAVN
jgi:hypothetical protein